VELRSVQESIYREKVQRARQQTEEERFADVLALSNASMARMHEGALWQAGSDDPAHGWELVRARLDRLRKVQDKGRFAGSRPGQHP